MRLLRRLRQDAFTIFTSIRDSKRGERKDHLENISNDIEQSYNEYFTLCYDLSTISDSVRMDAEKEALLHCYESSCKALDKLKTDIKLAQPIRVRQTCLYCLIGDPRTFDHYLPKESFPEHAVNSLNLMPCCSSCNELKGTSWLLDGRRQIINLYFEQLPAGKYLNATITFVNGDPLAEFELSNVIEMPDPTFQLIASHFDKLELLRRFSEKSGEVFSEVRTHVKYHTPHATVEDIREYCSTESDHLADTVHENYWKSALFGALSASSDFADWCLNPQ